MLNSVVSGRISKKNPHACLSKCIADNAGVSRGQGDSKGQRFTFQQLSMSVSGPICPLTLTQSNICAEPWNCVSSRGPSWHSLRGPAEKNVSRSLNSGIQSLWNTAKKTGGCRCCQRRLENTDARIFGHYFTSLSHFSAFLFNLSFN